MSRYGGRRSGNDLAYGDDYGYGGGGGGGERWDRDRFERLRTRSRGGNRESESFRFEEDDYSRRRGGPTDRRDIRIEVDENRNRRDSGRDHNDRYAYDDNRYEPPRRARPDYLQEDRYTQTAGRELAPYRQPPSRYDRYAERDYYDVPDRKPQRPQYIRRQTSLDFDDRRQRTRYGDEDERDVNVSVNLRAPDPPRRPEPPRYDHDEQDYRDVQIFRERDREIYRRRRSKSRSSSSEKEIIERPRRKKEKKAHTVFPKRLANLRAILEFGHPYEEDENFYYVRWNSTQDEINEVLENSKSYSSRETKTLMIEDSAPSPPEIRVPEPEPEIIETTTTKIIENPTDEEIEKYGRAGSVADRYERAESVAESRREGKSRESRSLAGSRHSRRSSSESTTTLRQSEVFDKTEALSIKSPSPSRAGRRGRSKSRARGSEIFIETRDDERESGSLVLPSRGKSRSRRAIEEDISRFELEKKAIKYDRRAREDAETAERLRDEDEYEIVDDKEIRLERNSSGQMQLERDAPRRSKSKRARRPTQADVRAAMFSLT